MTEEQKRLKELKKELELIENNASGYYDDYDIKTKTFTRLTKEEAIERVLQKYGQLESNDLMYNNNHQKNR